MPELSLTEELRASVKIGRLEEVNGHRQLTGILWEADGTQWRCQFKPEHTTALSGAWMQRVELTGQVRVEEDGTPTLYVEKMTILDEEKNTRLPQTDEEAFWQTLSLEELAERQGIGATTDLDAIAALWPADDDPDELFRYLLQERRERLKLAEHRGDTE